MFRKGVLPLIESMGGWLPQQENDLVETVTSQAVLVFHLFWLVPMTFLSFVLSSIWYGDIAEHLFKKLGRVDVYTL